MGVLKSLPAILLKARNLSVMSVQTTCLPWSPASVSQDPLRYHPVFNLLQQGSSGLPNTLSGPFLIGAIISE